MIIGRALEILNQGERETAGGVLLWHKYSPEQMAELLVGLHTLRETHAALLAASKAARAVFYATTLAAGTCEAMDLLEAAIAKAEGADAPAPPPPAGPTLSDLDSED